KESKMSKDGHGFSLKTFRPRNPAQIRKKRRFLLLKASLSITWHDSRFASGAFWQANCVLTVCPINERRRNTQLRSGDFRFDRAIGGKRTPVEQEIGGTRSPRDRN